MYRSALDYIRKKERENIEKQIQENGNQTDSYHSIRESLDIIDKEIKNLRTQVGIITSA